MISRNVTFVHYVNKVHHVKTADFSAFNWVGGKNQTQANLSVHSRHESDCVLTHSSVVP